MQRLVRGVHQFQTEVVGKKAEFFAGLAKGQRPHTLFITCSDSRLSPNLLTQTEPGEIFILRNAGNIIPPHSATVGGETATIEYAVGVLEVTDIVVCGHTHCGAMTGLLHPEKLADLPAFRAWLGHADATRRIVAENYAALAEEERLNVAIQENVLVQLEHLRTLPVVAAVFAYDPVESQFLALAHYQPKPSQPRSFTRLSSI